MANTEQDSVRDRSPDPLGTAVDAVRGSALNVAFAIGVVVLLAGVLLDVTPEAFDMQGVWAAILFLWGGALIALAAGVHAFVWWSRN